MTRPDLDGVRRRLAACSTVSAAADAVMELCLASGLNLPSIYLERGGRLRCVAQRGYWQVYDGLAPGAGVLGSTLVTGETQVVRETGSRSDFIRAVPGVLAEVAVPIRVDGRTAGVFNVESRTALSVDDVQWVEAVGDAFGQRLGELGGPPPEAPAELLARLGYELACLDDGDEVASHTVAAALTVAGMSGGCLFLGTGGRLTAAHHSGDFGQMLAGLTREQSGQLAEYVCRATSSWADGTGDGDGFEAASFLRENGVGSLVVLALVAKGRREGILVLADAAPHASIEAAIPLLELLASTSTAMVVSARTSAALQVSERDLAHRARHDPLTGVANRSSLLEVMRAAMQDDVVRARLVVLFIDLDDFKDVNDRHGHLIGDQLLVVVADRLRNAARDDDLVARLGGDEFVILCRAVESIEEATAVSERIIGRLGEPFGLGDVAASVTACIGIAAADGFASPEQVLESADRAMYAAKRSGTGTWYLAEAFA